MTWDLSVMVIPALHSNLLFCCLREHFDRLNVTPQATKKDWNEKQEHGNQKLPNHSLLIFISTSPKNKKPNIAARLLYSEQLNLIIHRNQKLFVISSFFDFIVYSVHCFYWIHVG